MYKINIIALIFSSQSLASQTNKSNLLIWEQKTYTAQQIKIIKSIAIDLKREVFQTITLDLSNRAKKNSTAKNFFIDLNKDFNFLTKADLEFLEKTVSKETIRISAKSGGLVVKLGETELEYAINFENNQILENGKPFANADLKDGLQKYIESLGYKTSQNDMRSLKFLPLYFIVGNKVHAVVLPLALVVAQIIVRHVIIGATVGAVSGGTLGAIAGCGAGVHTKKEIQTWGEGCKEGAKASLDLALKAGALGTIPLTNFALWSLWDGDGGVFWWRNRNIDPKEIPKIRSFIKIAGGLGILAAVYYPVKGAMEGYGVKLSCGTNGDWELYSMNAGQVQDLIAKNPISRVENIKQHYYNLMVNRGVADSEIDTYATKLASEHDARTEFCKKNPLKKETAVFSDIKSALKIEPAPSPKVKTAK